MRKFYVDECIAVVKTDFINKKRGYRAVHAARDLGFSGKKDDFHIEQARRRGAILLTTNHREFRHGLDYLRGHPGIVVLDPGTAGNGSEQLHRLIDNMISFFWAVHGDTELPFSDDLRERRLVLSAKRAYLDDVNGKRFDLDPAGEEWYPSPERAHGKRSIDPTDW